MLPGGLLYDYIWQCQDSHASVAECSYHATGSKGNLKLAAQTRYDINVQWMLPQGAIHAPLRYTNNFS